jgi:hypothetical protein
MSGTLVLSHIKTLLESVKALENLYPGRSFTLDGHLVGSIGEVLAAEVYGLQLATASTTCHDGTCRDGRNVQVKLTQRRRVALNSEPDYLIVLQLTAEASVREIYNGPGAGPWACSGPMHKNGQRSISISKLSQLNSGIRAADRIRQIQTPTWFRACSPGDAA